MVPIENRQGAVDSRRHDHIAAGQALTAAEQNLPQTIALINSGKTVLQTQLDEGPANAPSRISQEMAEVAPRKNSVSRDRNLTPESSASWDFRL